MERPCPCCRPAARRRHRTCVPPGGRCRHSSSSTRCSSPTSCRGCPTSRTAWTSATPSWAGRSRRCRSAPWSRGCSRRCSSNGSARATSRPWGWWAWVPRWQGSRGPGRWPAWSWSCSWSARSTRSWTWARTRTGSGCSAPTAGRSSTACTPCGASVRSPEGCWGRPRWGWGCRCRRTWRSRPWSSPWSRWWPGASCCRGPRTPSGRTSWWRPPRGRPHRWTNHRWTTRPRTGPPPRPRADSVASRHGPGGCWPCSACWPRARPSSRTPPRPGARCSCGPRSGRRPRSAGWPSSPCRGPPPSAGSSATGWSTVSASVGWRGSAGR